MNHEKSFEDVARETVYDVFERRKLEEAHQAELEAKSDSLAEEKAEKRFQAKKEVFQIEVLKQLQAEGIKKEGLNLSSASPLITDTYLINDVELFTDDYIPESVVTDPNYEDNILVKNGFSLEFQEVNNKTGKRKFVWKNPVTLACICNPINLTFLSSF